MSVTDATHTPSRTANARYANSRCLTAFLAITCSKVLSLSDKSRHVGDAVPPLISYQLAHLAHWTLTGKRPK